MPEIALEPRPGDSLGPYRITRVIGRGRMGIVFEGTADGEDPVALKVVTTELSQDDVFVRRFRREVQAAQKINHPNVVPVLAHGEEGGLPYLVQRLIPGGSLADRIAVRGRLELPYTVELLGAAAAGIDALHAAGLVHRDIKPANILLEGDTPYVSDFGLAKDSQASNLTRPGQALGLARLHVAGADPRRGRQPRDRRLRARLRDVGVPDRRAAVRRPSEHARPVRPPAGGSRPTSPRRCPRSARRPPARSRARSRRSPRNGLAARPTTSPASLARPACSTPHRSVGRTGAL